ncbi:MAG: hypothetical protein J6P29_04535, partial [Acetobacter sp.]|nr:hypothetical protein [Acetobacter sp.]
KQFASTNFVGKKDKAAATTLNTTIREKRIGGNILKNRLTINSKRLSRIPTIVITKPLIKKN